MDGSVATLPPFYASFNIGAVFVCLTALIYMVLRRRYDMTQSKLFIGIIVAVALSAACDAAAELMRAYGTAATCAVPMEVAGYLYFVTHVLTGPLFYLYVLAVCREADLGGRPVTALVAVPFLVTEVVALTNPFTHWMYSYGPNLEFTRSWGIYLSYAVGAFYLVMSFVQLMRRWHALTQVKRRALCYFYLMAATGIIVQLVVPSLHVELFAEALAIVGVMMFVENEEDLIDSETDVYNRYALEMDLAMYDSSGKNYNVVVIRLTNIDSFSHFADAGAVKQHMTGLVADYLKTVMPWYYVYRASSSRYVLVDPRMNHERAQSAAHDIAVRFKQGWSYRDADIDLRAVVALARVPEDLPQANDVLYLVDTPMPPVMGKDVLMEDDLNYVMRRAEVERAVQRGFDEDGYEVYYQPIFDRFGKVRSAEALMRLHDSTLGDVPPFEFIEVAERIGCIEEIGEVALREVCAFLQTGVPQRLGVGHINVNLSVVQCMRLDFSSHVGEVVASYGVDPRQMSFEITESVAAGDYEFLGRTMTQLKQGGHEFAMDDYGTGYSNMHSLVSLDFDVVKIDKSVLWDAEKSDMGMVILQNGVKMMRDIGCEVLVEGVETESQVALLQRLGVDYYQGFYYARPMPKGEFVAFLSNMSE